MNVTALVDTSGTVLERVVYDPYGNPTFYDGSWTSPSATSSYDNVVLYCGYRWNGETGLYHVRRRLEGGQGATGIRIHVEEAVEAGGLKDVAEPGTRSGQVQKPAAAARLQVGRNQDAEGVGANEVGIRQVADDLRLAGLDGAEQGFPQAGRCVDVGRPADGNHPARAFLPRLDIHGVLRYPGPRQPLCPRRARRGGDQRCLTIETSLPRGENDTSSM